MELVILLLFYSYSYRSHFNEMFYGGGGVGNGRIGEKGRGGGRSERFEQMSKQQEIIEQKKREIEAKMEAERQKKQWRHWLENLVHRKV